MLRPRLRFSALKTLFTLLLILLPLSGWFVLPQALFALGKECRANKISIVDQAAKTVVVTSHWWMHPGFTEINGNYAGEITLYPREGLPESHRQDGTYVLDYALTRRFIQITTRSVSYLRGDRADNPAIRHYIDPLLSPGFTAAIHLFRLNDGQMLTGLNDRPRQVCNP